MPPITPHSPQKATRAARRKARPAGVSPTNLCRQASISHATQGKAGNGRYRRMHHRRDGPAGRDETHHRRGQTAWPRPTSRRQSLRRSARARTTKASEAPLPCAAGAPTPASRGARQRGPTGRHTPPTTEAPPPKTRKSRPAPQPKIRALDAVRVVPSSNRLLRRLRDSTRGGPEKNEPDAQSTNATIRRRGSRNARPRAFPRETGTTRSQWLQPPRAGSPRAALRTGRQLATPSRPCKEANSGESSGKPGVDGTAAPVALAVFDARHFAARGRIFQTFPKAG